MSAFAELGIVAVPTAIVSARKFESGGEGTHLCSSVSNCSEKTNQEIICLFEKETL